MAKMSRKVRKSQPLHNADAAFSRGGTTTLMSKSGQGLDKNTRLSLSTRVLILGCVDC